MSNGLQRSIISLLMFGLCLVTNGTTASALDAARVAEGVGSLERGETHGDCSGELVATFLSDDPSPGPGTVTMLAGAAGGAAFDIQITVDGIDDLFGAAFDVLFDPAVVQFVGFDGSGSILGPDAIYLAAEPLPGTLVVAATLVGPGAGIDDATGLLLTLSFEAVAATSGTAIAFAPDSVLIDSNPTEIPGVGWFGGTLVSECETCPAITLLAPAWQPPPAQVPIEAAADVLDLLYRGRDTLKGTEKGGDYVDLYYRHAAEVSTILRADPELRARAYGLLHRHLPKVSAALERRPLELTSAERADLDRFLGDVSARSGPELQRTLRRIRFELTSRTLLPNLGFVAE